MKCQEVQYKLFELADNMLDAGLTEKLNRHLQTCPICQQEWDAIQRFKNLLSTAIPTYWMSTTWSLLDRPHLNPFELWTLAEYQDSNINHEQRSLWEHMLDCRSCYEKCGWLRNLLKDSKNTIMPDLQVSHDTILRNVQAMKLTIICQWIGTKLHLRTAAIISRQIVRGPLEEWTINHQFEHYAVTITLSIDSLQKKTCRIQLMLAMSLDEVVFENLRADLYHEEKGLLGSRTFREAKADFPPIIVGHYYIELIGAGDTFGFIELPIVDTPVESKEAGEN